MFNVIASSLFSFFRNKKDKIFSYTNVFLFIFACIFGIFILFNSSTILSKFGFETTANLKAELAKTQAELKRATEANAELNRSIERLKQEYENSRKIVNQYAAEKEAVERQAEELAKKKEAREKQLLAQLRSKTTYSKDSVTFPVKELNQVSENNIVALNEAYDSFFVKVKSSDVNTVIVDTMADSIDIDNINIDSELIASNIDINQPSQVLSVSVVT